MASQAPPSLLSGSSCLAARAAWATAMCLAASHMDSIASVPLPAGGPVPSRVHLLCHVFPALSFSGGLGLILTHLIHPLARSSESANLGLALTRSFHMQAAVSYSTWQSGPLAACLDALAGTPAGCGRRQTRLSACPCQQCLQCRHRQPFICPALHRACSMRFSTPLQAARGAGLGRRYAPAIAGCSARTARCPQGSLQGARRMQGRSSTVSGARPGAAMGTNSKRGAGGRLGQASTVGCSPSPDASHVRQHQLGRESPGWEMSCSESPEGSLDPIPSTSTALDSDSGLWGSPSDQLGLQPGETLPARVW